MEHIWQRLKASRQEFKPLVVSWLFVALLLPTLLGLVAPAQATPMAELLQASELQLCAQQGLLPHGKGQPRQHNQDCPCCLPGAMASHAAPLLPTMLDPAPIAPRLVALVPAEWAIPAQLPHDRNLALQTGPPAFFQS
jgi:hypothetical protein